MTKTSGSSPSPDAPTPGKRPSKRRAKAGTRKTVGKAASKPAAKSVSKGAAKGAAKGGPAKKAARTAATKRAPSRKTFLVAATVPDGEGRDHVCVYAAVTRTPEEALAAVRAALGAAMPVEFTGKLSGRMAKALGLTADEVRRI